jgi:2-oxoglutarate dehydrogenase E2 component (dihydrolipoamide succinyltransferase)
MAQVEVVMPKMGESIVEGTVIEWHKEVGDRVEEDETLLEIATDKVDSEIPAPEAGYLKEILVQEGETVEVGTPIALLVENEEELGETEPAADASEEAPTGTPEPEESEERRDEEEPVSPAGAASEADGQSAERAPSEDGESEEVQVVMPKMGESIVEGTIIEWFKQPGDSIEEDEALLEIATDKVDTEIPSPAGGTLQEIIADEGATVEVGQPLAIIATGAPVEVPDRPSDTPEDSEGEEIEEESTPSRESVQPEPSGDGSGASEPGKIPRRGSTGEFFSPLVRSIAEKEGLSVEELERVSGSGAEGRVTKDDVLSYLEEKEERAESPEKTQSEPRARQEAPTSAEAQRELKEVSDQYGDRVEVVEMDRMRQVIAEHMIHSKQTSAHVTSFTEADVTNLVRLREQKKQSFREREGVRLSYTPFFVEAAIEALRNHPWLNASVEDDHIIVKKEYHVGIAVAVENTGLLVPVVRNAGQKNLVGLNRDIADLARRARNRQLQPDELQGGTFTVTNIGSLGSMMGTPVINQPQVAILGPGAIKKRPVVIEHPEQGDTIGIRHMMYLSLSYDHRIIDGAMAASFLQEVVENLESYDPDMAL